MNDKTKFEVIAKIFEEMLTFDDEMFSVHLIEKMKITPEDYVKARRYLEKTMRKALFTQCQPVIWIEKGKIFLDTMSNGLQEFTFKEFKKKVTSDAQDAFDAIEVVEFTKEEGVLYSQWIKDETVNSLLDKIAEAVAMKILWRLHLRE